MVNRRTVAGDVRADAPDVRHCSVCFAVIREGEPMVRSREGHCYCARCAAGFFDEGGLRALREEDGPHSPKQAVPV